MAEQMSEYMSEHIPGLKLVRMSQHMSRTHVRTHASKGVRTQSRTFPTLYYDKGRVRAQTRFDAITSVRTSCQSAQNRLSGWESDHSKKRFSLLNTVPMHDHYNYNIYNTYLYITLV